MDSITALYLNRLDLGPEPPSVEALGRLHRAHVERVPYETFWIPLAQGWGIDLAESTQRIAGKRRGGYCFHLNGAFFTLLKALGYRVSLNVAGVYSEGGPSEGSLLNHTAIIAEDLPSDANPGGRWWVDVGLGDALHDPLPLVQGDYQQGPMRFRIEQVEAGGIGDWRLIHDASGSFTGVILVDHAVEIDAFTQRHQAHATSPDAGYARVVTAQRRSADGATMMRGCVLKRASGEDSTRHTFESLDEWLAVLDSEFGLSFDDMPRETVDALWATVRRSHDEWMQANEHEQQ